MFDSYGFAGARSQSRIIRTPSNPLDKSTIVSILPKEIYETKPTLSPGTFHIPAAKPDDFELLVVGMSSWWKEVEEGQPYLEIPTSSLNMAESIIRDYVNGIVGCNMGDKMPGLFFVPGAYNKITILAYVGADGTTFKQLMDVAKQKQINWYKELVSIADVDWARTNGNPISVSDDSRMAAQFLGLKDKGWMQDFRAYELVPCKACGELMNPAYPVCKHCKAITNPKAAEELGLTFAK